MVDASALCIDQGWVQDAYDELDGIHECMSGMRSLITCDSFEVQFSGDLSERLCGELRPRDNSLPPSETALKIECIAYITIKSTYTETNYYGDVTTNPDADEEAYPSNAKHTVTLFCSGSAVGNIVVGQQNSNGLMQINFECYKGDGISICMDTTGSSLNAVGQDGHSATIWGAVLCREYFDNSYVPGYLSIPALPEDCPPGREGLYMLQQNANALAKNARTYGQKITKYVGEETGTESVIAIPEMTADDTWLVIGHFKVCIPPPAEVSRFSRVKVTFNPTVGCPSSQFAARETSIMFVHMFFSSAPNIVDDICFYVPFAFCGQCNGDSSVTTALNIRIDCDPDLYESSLTSQGVEVRSVDRQWCGVKISPHDADIIDAGSESIYNCVTPSVMKSLSDSVYSLEAYCAEFVDISPLGKKNMVESMELINDFEIYGPTPPDPEWEEIPRRSPLAAINVTVNNVDISPLESLAGVRSEIIIEIFCGGTLIFTRGLYFWGRYGDSQVSECLPSCPVTEPLTAVVTVVSPVEGWRTIIDAGFTEI